jgi:hypothetical protein
MTCAPHFRRRRDLEVSLQRGLPELRDLIKDRAGLYHPFDTRPGSGKKWRHIDNPRDPLLTVQRRLLRFVFRGVRLPDGMVGGIEGKSIVDAVAPHAGKDEVVTMDIAGCFDSMNERKVERALRETFGPSDQILQVLVGLTTFENRLPQGAPTSTLLSNLCLAPFFEELRRFCGPRGLVTTIWVDDIMVSGPYASRVVGTVHELAKKYGHRVREDKTRVMHKGEAQVALSATLNRGPSAGWRKIQQLRDRVLALSDLQDVPCHKLRSVWGHLGSVVSINPTQGERLLYFASLRIPRPYTGGRSGSGKEYRPCRSKTEHRDN